MPEGEEDDTFQYLCCELISVGAPTVKQYNCRKIAITLKIPEKGEGKAHTCVIAWLRQLTRHAVVKQEHRSGKSVKPENEEQQSTD
jgi:hypothetical protein